MAFVVGRSMWVRAVTLALIAGSVATVEANGPHRRKKQVVCPPETIIIEPLPTESPMEVAPSEVAPGQEPAAPEVPAEPNAADAPLTSEAMNEAIQGQYDVASASNIFAPNMLGDQFAGTRAALIIQPPIRYAELDNDFGGSPVVVGPNSTQVGAGTLDANVGPNPTFPFDIDLNLGTLSIPQLIVNNAGPPDVNGDIALQENAQLTALAQPFFEAGLGQPGTLSYIVGETNNFSSFDQFAVIYAFIPDPIIIFGVPNPSDGGVVGRTKIADDNNPLPRDRFIFNYDYFNNVPLSPNGWNVNRVSLGFEKTFFNQMASVECRFPFASTLDSNFTQGAETSNIEFGNINVTMKALLYTNRYLAFAGGVGVSLPTADDVRVQLSNGADVIRINNDAVLVTPYVAALWTPNDRIFAQTWMQYSIDTNGNPVLLNSNGAGLADVGRLTSQTLMQLDGQIGYWIYQQHGATGFQLGGLAPFIELHYNSTLTDADTIQAQQVLIGDLGGRVDELNLSVGLTAVFGANLVSNLGVVMPLKDDDDRFFDYQVGFRTNYYFGATARDRQLSTRTSNF